MSSYFIRRFLLMIPTFLGITVLVFTITRFVPGGPIERMIVEMQMQAASGDNMSVNNQRVGGATTLSDDEIAELEAYYGFDKPVIVSYFYWLGKVLRGDLGHSTRYHDPVWEIIQDKLPVSLFYGLVTFLLTYSICIPLGILKAIKHNSLIDNSTSFIVFLGYSIPNFVVGLLLIMTVASQVEYFPMGGFVSDDFENMSFLEQMHDIFRHAVLPLLAYMAGSFAVMTMMVKNSLMDHLASDFMRTALAKGVSFKKAVWKHAFRNSMIPLATSLGSITSVFLAGSYLVEKVFNIDGIGLLGYESVVNRDYPVVMGTLVISSLLFLLGNILSDVFVALVDPRVKFR